MFNISSDILFETLYEMIHFSLGFKLNFFVALVEIDKVMKDIITYG